MAVFTMTQELTNYTNTTIAAGISGLSASCSGFFFQSIKKRLQSNQKLPRISEVGLRKWTQENFRGVISYSVLLTPTAIIQQISNKYLQDVKFKDNYAIQYAGTFFSGALGGIASTIVENILLHQQLNSINAYTATNKIYQKSPRGFLKGLELVALREGFFGYCYLKGKNQFGDYAKNNYGSHYELPAQISVGIVGAVISHPLDTMATVMQINNHCSIPETIQFIAKSQSPIKTLYSGLAARIGLFTTVMLVMTKTQEAVLRQLEKK